MFEIFDSSLTFPNYSAERHVPERIRDLLLSESTLNDGAGTPFVYISLLLLIRSSSVISSSIESESTWELLKIWFVQIICYNIVGGIVFGLVCGTFCRQALMRSKKLGWLEKEDNLIFTLSLAMGVIGGGKSNYLLSLSLYKSPNRGAKKKKKKNSASAARQEDFFFAAILC